MTDFNFDTWLMLANTSPERFEQNRRNAVDAVIASGADPRQLKGLQWRIDLERTRARTPIKACLRLSCLMWDTFFELRDVFNRDTLAHGCPAAGAKPLARVIPFRKQDR